jgi:GNAT superfamily N-acetyltransferase
MAPAPAALASHEPGAQGRGDAAPAPSNNDEYLLYQTLLGSFPVAGGPLGEYADRIAAYMRKAIREAKVRTSWANVNAPYEDAVEAFVRALLEERAGNAFLDDLRAAVGPIAWTGLLNGLSMAAIKFTSPGVPDIYQGAELWISPWWTPTNRRPVTTRTAVAARGNRGGGRGERGGDMRDAFGPGRRSRAKLYVIWRLLQLRKEREALFRHGGYTAVRTTGLNARHLVAFTRRHGGEALLTIAPRLIAGLGVEPGAVPCGASLWSDTRIELPMFKEGAVLRERLHRGRAAGGGWRARRRRRPRALSGGGAAALSRMESVCIRRDPMEALLDNIVWHCLAGAQARFASGPAHARRYARGLPALAGFADPERPDFDALAPHVEPGEHVYCLGWSGAAPRGWVIEADTAADQYVWAGPMPLADPAPEAIPLERRHVAQMVELAALTRPGPFGERNAELGEYYGIFEGDRLVAMTGERMEAGKLREVSAVCTHPDFQGRGLARRLTGKLVRLQMSRGQVPFLHAMHDNGRARDLYERMGFRHHREVALRVLARAP